MSKFERLKRRRRFMVAGATALLAGIAGPGCATLAKTSDAKQPANAASKKTATINGLTGPTMMVGESEREVRTYDISQNIPQLGTHLFRTRYVDVAPGGIVPIHSHVNRPSMYLITSGEIIVHQTGIAEPVLLKAGDAHMAAQGAAHWWENKGEEKVGIWVADICPENDPMVKKCELEGGR